MEAKDQIVSVVHVLHTSTLIQSGAYFPISLTGQQRGSRHRSQLGDKFASAVFVYSRSLSLKIEPSINNPSPKYCLLKWYIKFLKLKYFNQNNLDFLAYSPCI